MQWLRMLEKRGKDKLERGVDLREITEKRMGVTVW